MALLELNLVVAGYGLIEVLNIISLTVERGEIVAIIGANGAGKSTTLMCISGAVRVREGRIIYGGRPIHNLPASQIVEAGISQVPEGRKIFPQLTVRENLEMGAYTRTDHTEVRKDLQHVFELFPILGERHAQKGGTLSGGEQQMLAIARALMSRPKLLMLDEPSLGLAPLVETKIFDVIRQLNRDGMSILLVEQNAQAALRIAHRGYVMETGSFTLVDKADVLLRNPAIRGAYLGGKS